MIIDWLEQTEIDVPPENDWLSPNELDRLATLRIPKRRADWRLGRWTAKRAVASFLALPGDRPALANIEIRPAPSGAPEVFLHDQPASVAISLSHSSGVALCAVAAPGLSFGCDLEKIESRDDAFIADYFTPEEKSLIARSAIADRPLLLTLLWSAKESALKAMHAGLRLPTTSVSAQLGESWPRPKGKCPHNSMFNSTEEWLPMGARYSADQMFTGYWCTKGNLVRTVVSDVPQFTLHQLVETLLATSFGPRVLAPHP
ncbi:MAG TPA: 4'-phosphopantetheinyl transferase superfamily protein [Candidatus Sulfotelmatobacter sp.]|jgi:4'-phosphopantetheinyl transferase|nr:4'-phosphopantetheinyl transferase superfamily protein [Candidatus Sulfotelmatobacter sp.]